VQDTNRQQDQGDGDQEREPTLDEAGDTKLPELGGVVNLTCASTDESQVGCRCQIGEASSSPVRVIAKPKRRVWG